MAQEYAPWKTNPDLHLIGDTLYSGDPNVFDIPPAGATAGGGAGATAGGAVGRPGGATGAVGHPMPGGGSQPPGERPIFDPPEFEMPEAPGFEYEEYAGPERDVERVEELRTKAAGPGVRRAVQAMQRAMMQEYKNPNLARLAMRDILAGHGEALSSVYGGAGQTAERQYAGEFAGQQAGARMKFEAGYGKAAQEYQATWAGKREEAMANWQAQVEAEKRDYEMQLMEGGWM